LFLLQFQFAQTQSFLLEESELEIVDSAFCDNNEKIFRILHLDENDCFNCQMKFKYLATELSGKKVHLLFDNQQKDQEQQFIREYNLDESISIIRRPKLLKLLKDKSIKIFESRSFLVEINGAIITFFGNGKTKQLKRGVFQIDTSIKISKINTGNNYVTNITKIKKYKKDFIAVTFPKSELIYLKTDSIHQILQLDSALQVKAFAHLLDNRPDSILKLNSYSKSLKTYMEYRSRFGMQSLSVQNFSIIDDYCFVYISFSFPIWISSSSIVMYAKPFILKMKLSDIDNWDQTDIFIVNYNGLVERSVVPYAHNYFDFNKDLISCEIGYLLIEDSVFNNEPIISHTKYSLFKNQFTSLDAGKSYHSDTIICRYNSEEFENLALIHTRLNPNSYHYTYVPMVIRQNEVFNLNLNLKRRDTYSHYCTIKQDNDFLLDFSSVNGLCYFIYYKIENGEYFVTNIEPIQISGVVLCAEFTKNELNVLTKNNNKYFRKSIQIKD
jgi:hypothetical protein